MGNHHQFHFFWSALITAVLCLLGLFNGYIPAANALTSEQIQAIDNYILSQFLPNNYIPGLGLAIVHGNDTLSKGYGIADVELGIPTRNNTLFGIGSISKSFTALIVVRVLNSRFPELGESVLDVPIRTLIPTNGFMLIDRFRSENMNFRDLLSHRVCVSPIPIRLNVRTYNSTSEYMYRQRYAIEFCPVRTEPVYHSGLIQMAGELAAVIANTTFAQLLDELLSDLGMTETGYIKESDDFDTWPNLSKAYYRYQGVFGIYNPELIKAIFVAPGTGGIISSAADFIRYLTLWLNNGRIGLELIIPEELMKWTRRFSNSLPALAYKTSPPDLLYGDLGYGLGLFLGTYEGFFKYGNGGYLRPYLSLMTIVPELNVAIMTVGNGPGTLKSISQETMHARLLSIITEIGKNAATSQNNGPSSIASTLLNENQRSFQNISLKANLNSFLYEHWQRQPKNESLLGNYGNPLLGEFNVTAINSTTMYLKYGMFGTGYLAQRGNSAVYEVHWDSDIVHVFYVDGFDELPVVTLNFTTPLVAELALEAAVIPFYKDLSLDLLPVQPWDPNSC